MKKYLSIVEKVRSDRILPVTSGKGLQLPSTKVLPTKVKGLYWIYTNYNIQDIISCIPSSQSKAVDISTLAKQHQNLSNIHKSNYCGFNLVYNGIGGNTGLRERIQQEFNGGEGTGSLGILKTTLNDLGRWRISYVILNNNKIASDLDVDFDEFASVLERTWRLEYGWPLLCKT